MDKGRDILSEFGTGTMDQASRSGGGGAQSTRDVMNYKPPIGPSNINDGRKPGLHGEVHPCGTQHE